MKNRGFGIQVALALMLTAFCVTAAAVTGPRPSQARGEETPTFARRDIDDTGAWIDAAVVDMDQDGDPDVVAVVGYPASYGTVHWWESDGSPADGGWTDHEIADLPYPATAVSVCDLDDDGDPDVIVAADDRFQMEGTVDWWENDGTPRDGGWTGHAIGEADGLFDIVAVDLDNDTDLDVAAAAHRAGEILWWESDGTPRNGGWVKHLVAQDLKNPSAVAAADLNHDTHLDLVGAVAGDPMGDDGFVAWWKSDGTPADGGWISETLVSNFALARDVHIADMDQDGDPDVLAVGVDMNAFTWWENTAMGLVIQSVAGDFGYAHAVFACDLDGDGDTDVLAASTDDGLAWWENDGSASFVQHAIDDAKGWASVQAANLDGDADLDLISTAFPGSGLAWWEQGGLPTQYVYLPMVIRETPPPPPMTLYLHEQDPAPQSFLSPIKDEGTHATRATHASDPREWEMALGGDLIGTQYGYNLYASVGPYQGPIACDVEILLRSGSTDTMLASWPSAFTVPTGSGISQFTGGRTGLDPKAAPGDQLILRIRPHTGYVVIYTGEHLSQEVYSFITVPGY